MESGIDPLAVAAGIALAVFLLSLLVGSVAMKLSDFIEELRYVNMEIRRASPRERAAWRRRRRRLWLSLLPFFKE